MSGLSRADFESLWARLDAEAMAAKQSQEATVRLTSFYGRLDAGDREVVDEVLAEWVVSGDDRRRFDALALICEFEIRSAVPALRTRLESVPEESGGPLTDERERLERLVVALS